MHKQVNPWQATVLLCLGTLSFTALAAQAPVSNDQAQQSINQTVNQAAIEAQQKEEAIQLYPQQNYPVVKQGVDESIAQQIRENNQNEKTLKNTSKPTVGSISTNQNSVKQEEQALYPAFTQEEIIAIADQANQPDVMPETPVVEDPVEEAKDQAEYIEKNAELYRHIGPNPVYTYGKDSDGKGACVGTQEMCESSALMWQQFEENAANSAPIVVLEGENRGDLLMPAAYQNPDMQPQVSGKDCANYGEGYQFVPAGSSANGVPGPHCGKLDTNGSYIVIPK